MSGRVLTFALAAMFAAPAALADTAAVQRTWLERVAISAADKSCNLFSEGERLALQSGIYQAEGELLRANKTAAEMEKLAAPFFDKPWIDAALRPGKSGGAFAHPTVPSAHPYLLLNYHGKARDVMTLAHELGHFKRRVTVLGCQPAAQWFAIIMIDFAERSKTTLIYNLNRVAGGEISADESYIGQLVSALG